MEHPVYGSSAFNLAVKEGETETKELLIQQSANFNIDLIGVGKNRNTPMMLFVLKDITQYCFTAQLLFFGGIVLSNLTHK